MSKLNLNLVWKMIRLESSITAFTSEDHDKRVKHELNILKFENIAEIIEQSYDFLDYSVKRRYQSKEEYQIKTTADAAANILMDSVYSSELYNLKNRYPNLSYYLIKKFYNSKKYYINFRNAGCVYEYLETLSTQEQLMSFDIIRYNYTKYGILFEKTIKFLVKNSFDESVLSRINSFICSFTPNYKLGKGADKLFVIYKKLAKNVELTGQKLTKSYDFNNLIRYVKDKPYIFKTSYREFSNFLEGFLWLFPNRNERKIKFDCTDVAPSFFYTIGKLSTDLRWAAIYNRYSNNTYSTSKFSDSYEVRKYFLSKHDINWECVKEVQSLRVEGKMRLFNSHPCFPKARGFMKQHGFYVASSSIPDTINVKALNLIKSEPNLVKDGDYLEDCIKLSNIFGMEIVHLLKKLNEASTSLNTLLFGGKRPLNDTIHDYVNDNKIMNVKDALPQQWNQFFYNNPELTQYAHHITPDQPLFKSTKEFLVWVRNKKYTGTEGFDSLADVCARNNLDQDQFDSLKDYISKGTNKISEMLPFVRIDGSTIPEVGHQYILEKLDADDPLALIVGVETDCCQHIEGVGKPVAIHSWEKASSAVYVVRKNGQVIAQSWVWRNTQNGVVFDSIESKKGVDVSKMALLFKELAFKLIGKLGIEHVFIGDTSFGLTRSIVHELNLHKEEKFATVIIDSCSYMDGRDHYLLIGDPVSIQEQSMSESGYW